MVLVGEIKVLGDENRILLERDIRSGHYERPLKIVDSSNMF